MPNQSGSLKWIEYLAAINGQLEKTPNAKRPELATAINLKRAIVYPLLDLKPVLGPATLDEILKVAQADPANSLSFNSLRALARLKGKVADFNRAAHEALELALTRHLTTKQIGALVEWMADGKPVGEFDPSKVVRQGKRPKPSTEPLTPEGGPQAQEQTPAAPQTIGQRVGAAIDRIWGGFKGLEVPPKASKPPQGAKQAPGLKPLVKSTGKGGKWAAKIFWHWSLKHVHHFFKAVARQVVPGSKGIWALLRWVVYGLCQLAFAWALARLLASLLAPWAKPWVDYPFRYVVGLAAVQFPAWAWRLAQEHLAFAAIAGAILLLGLGMAFVKQPIRTIVLLALLGAVWFYGRGWGTTELPSFPSFATAKPAMADQDKAVETSPPAPLALADKPGTSQSSGAPMPNLNKTTAPPSHLPPVPEELRGRMEDDADYTAEFAVKFFGTHYDKHGDWHNWFEYRVRDDYYDAFFKEFDIPLRWQEINDKQLTLAFEPSGKARLIRWDDTSDDFRVEGVLTTRSDQVYPRKFISRGWAALVISFAHKPDGSVIVYKVREIKPAP